MLRRIAVLSALLSMAPVAAWAQAPEDPVQEEEEDVDGNVARARDLAQTALERLDAKDYEEAFEKAEEAEKLYHAPIHLRVMAQALEGLGKRAEAAAIYERLVAEPLSPSAHPLFLDAQRFARARLKVLASRLPSILVKVEGVKRSEAKVTIDERVIETGPGVAVIVDPGEHLVRVESPGLEPFEKELKLEERGGVVVVRAVMLGEGEVPPAADGRADTSSSGPPIATWVLFGIGGAMLIGGGVLGTLTLVQAADLKERCPDFSCTESEKADHEQAVIMGWTSTGLLAAGGTLAVIGAIVWAVGDQDDDKEPAARIELGPGGFYVRGRF